MILHGHRDCSASGTVFQKVYAYSVGTAALVALGHCGTAKEYIQ